MGGPRFDAVHADRASRQRFEDLVERAGLVADEHQQRGAVVARGRERGAADHQEAGGVVGAVFDRAGHHFQAVGVGRVLAGDGRGVVGVARAAGGFSVTDDGVFLDLGQVLPQPGFALRQRQRVRIHALDVFDMTGARQQILVNAQLHLAADHQRRGQEQIERGLDGAGAGVLHRHHAEIGVARSDFVEHFLHRRQRQRLGRMTEVLVDRLLRERALGAEEADFQRLLLGQAGGHDFAEQPHQHFVRQRAFVAIDHAAQDLRLAFGTVVIDRGRELALGLADLVRPQRAFGDQALDLVIDAIDLRAHRQQIGLALGVERNFNRPLGHGLRFRGFGLGSLHRRLGRAFRGRLHGGAALALFSHGVAGTPA